MAGAMAAEQGEMPTATEDCEEDLRRARGDVTGCPGMRKKFPAPAMFESSALKFARLT